LRRGKLAFEVGGFCFLALQEKQKRTPKKDIRLPKSSQTWIWTSHYEKYWDPIKLRAN
jgi:hypothetical protein